MIKGNNGDEGKETQWFSKEKWIMQGWTLQIAY
jgi:hypothetical protein